MIGGINLGKYRFLISDISDDFSIDGILGVDFFKSHTICLDFSKKIAYVQRNKTAPEKFMFLLNRSELKKKKG